MIPTSAASVAGHQRYGMPPMYDARQTSVYDTTVQRVREMSTNRTRRTGGAEQRASHPADTGRVHGVVYGCAARPLQAA
ncbi:hypothetical protein GCM10010532_036380 [Dactylosporangium siamense]|uniref:Uncharacterized protein n=1 Tax=Dactylosporangium siamense TaxID=685454 RepID=A0A919PJG8_9ACTN|nr:hypothetical protein Dsi01nite_028800 [Dactylosporangium siamense]